jgi:hypothetical protein
MRLGNFASLTISVLIVFWRLIVVAMNSIWSIRHDRWVDASFWLTEDPLYQFELMLARLVLPYAISASVKLYAVEVTGILVWAGIAILLFIVVRRTATSGRLDEITLRWRQVVLILAVVFVAACGGALSRRWLPEALHVTANWWIATPLMLLTVVMSGFVPIVLISYLLWRNDSAAGRAA